MDIVQSLDGLGDYEKCASGLAECNDDMPCGMHDSWNLLRSRIIEYLKQTSIADIQTALEEKRKVLAKPRRGKRTAKK